MEDDNGTRIGTVDVPREDSENLPVMEVQVKKVRDLRPINVKKSTHARLVAYKISKGLKSMDAVVNDLLHISFTNPKEVSV